MCSVRGLKMIKVYGNEAKQLVDGQLLRVKKKIVEGHTIVELLKVEAAD